MGRPKKDPNAPVLPVGLFARIPKIIRKRGRAAGFEKLRDLSLAQWETLSAFMNPYAALKLCIEFDRHAMFAEVAQEKARGAFDRGLWDQFQEYLHGKTDAAPLLDNKDSALDSNDYSPNTSAAVGESHGSVSVSPGQEDSGPSALPEPANVPPAAEDSNPA